MISVRPIGKDGMMGDDCQKGSRPRALQFGFEPGKLLRLLLCRQRKIPSTLLLTIGTRHVAIQRQKGYPRIAGRKFKAIPARRHGPASGGRAVPAAARILEFSIHLTFRPALIVMISQHSIGGAREITGRVHLLELRLPAGGVGASSQLSIPVIS